MLRSYVQDIVASTKESKSKRSPQSKRHLLIIASTAFLVNLYRGAEHFGASVFIAVGVLLYGLTALQKGRQTTSEIIPSFAASSAASYSMNGMLSSLRGFQRHVLSDT